jgi:hypothetical protein
MNNHIILKFFKICQGFKTLSRKDEESIPKIEKEQRQSRS